MAKTEAQKRATKKWDEKNKAKKDYARYKAYAKKFILDIVTDEDTSLVKQWIEERIKK